MKTKLIQGDCIVEMQRLIDEGVKVDLIITSPPYNLGNKHHTGNNRFKPYSEYNDDMPEALYQQWQTEFLDTCYELLSDYGSILYNHKNRIRNGVQITPYEWILKSKCIIKQEIVWENGSQNFDKCRFYPMTERIYWLAKSAKTKLFNTINHKDYFDRGEWRPSKTDKEHKRAYPTQMCSDLISCFPDAQVVCDPFMGSGSTGVACKNLNRSFIGIELDEKYFEIAKDRIADKQKDFLLF